ncbi:MAG: hypothetical protein WCK51_05780 [Armatimonadota bacterium]
MSVKKQNDPQIQADALPSTSHLRNFGMALLTTGLLTPAVILGVKFTWFRNDLDACLSNVQRLGNALALYSADFDETYPASIRLQQGETCLVDERRTNEGVNVYQFKKSGLWNVVIGGYLKGSKPFKCPGEPTGLYKLYSSLSYTPLVGPTSLIDPNTCEQLNGIMGRNWGARTSQITTPSGTALLFEMISSMSKDYQLPAGTTEDHPWRVYASNTWCGTLSGSAVFPRRDIVFHYDEGNGFQGPHLGKFSVGFVDGHVASLGWEQATSGGSDNCSSLALKSVFDRRFPMGDAK